MQPHIMVVNDSQEILELYRLILEEEGYRVTIYSYSIHDMDEVKMAEPDLIILDIVFGGQPLGWQMLQKLKMGRDTASIAVIICTAALKEVREQEGYLKSKGVGVLLKPFDIDELINIVKRSIRRPVPVANQASFQGAASGPVIPTTTAE